MVNSEKLREGGEKTKKLREAREAFTRAFLEVYSDHIEKSSFTDFKLIMSLKYEDIDSFEFECTPVKVVRGARVRRELRKCVDGLWGG